MAWGDALDDILLINLKLIFRDKEQPVRFRRSFDAVAGDIQTPGSQLCHALGFFQMSLTGTQVCFNLVTAPFLALDFQSVSQVFGQGDQGWKVGILQQE